MSTKPMVLVLAGVAGAIAISGAIAAILTVGHHPTPSPRSSPQPAPVSAPVEDDAPLTVEQLIKIEEAFDETCRGESGDDPNTQAACDKRDALVAALRDAGKCYGPPDLPAYQQKWGACTEETQTAVAPEVAMTDSKVHYDPSIAAKKQQASYAEMQAYACMQERVRFELTMGETDRRRVVQVASVGCAAYMQQIGLKGQELHDVLTRMANRVVSDTEREGNS